MHNVKFCIYSQKSCFRSLGKITGPWDRGFAMIKDFTEKHKCNKICRAIELPNLTEMELKEPPFQLPKSPELIPVGYFRNHHIQQRHSTPPPSNINVQCSPHKHLSPAPRSRPKPRPICKSKQIPLMATDAPSSRITIGSLVHSIRDSEEDSSAP